MFTATKTFTSSSETKIICSLIQLLQIKTNQSTLFQVLCFLISELQSIAALVWLQTLIFSLHRYDKVTQYIYNIPKVITHGVLINVETNLASLEFSLLFSWAYVAICLLTLMFYWIQTVRGRAINTKTQSHLYILFQTYHSIIFWILNIAMMTSLPSQFSNIAADDGSRPQKIAIFVINVTMIATNHLIGIVSSILCFDPFYSKNIFSSQNAYSQMCTFALKAAISPVIAFYSSPQLNISLSIAVLLVLLTACKLFNLLYNIPFYHYSAMRIAVPSSTVAFWISFVNLILLLAYGIKKTPPLSAIYLVLLPLPLIIKGALGILGKMIESYMSFDSAKCNTNRQIMIKIFAYKLFSERIVLAINSNAPLDQAEIYFMGTLSAHSSKCQDEKCFCQIIAKAKNLTRIQYGLPDLKELLSIYSYKISYSCLEDAIKRIKHNNSLKIFLANLIFQESPDCLSPALSCLFSASDVNLGFSERMKKVTLRTQVQQRMNIMSNDKTDENIDIVKFVDYHQAINIFSAKLVDASDKYISFWEEYRNAALKIVRVVEKSEEIEELAEKIDRSWKHFTEKYEHFPAVMHVSYRLYLNLVRNAPFASNDLNMRLISKAGIKSCSTKIVSKHISELDVVSSQLMSFYISMSKERIGRILYASENISKNIGYHQKEVIGKNLDYLLPPHFAAKHTEYMQQHLSQSQSFMSEDYLTHEGFIKTNRNTIKSCVTHTSVFPYLTDELIYVSAVKIIPTRFEYIFVDDYGEISSYSAGVASTLRLQPHKKVHIKDICLNVEKLNIRFNFTNLLKSTRMREVSQHSDNSRKTLVLGSSKNFRTQIEINPSVENLSSTNEVNFIRQGDDIFLVKYKVQIQHLELENNIYLLTLDPIINYNEIEKNKRKSVFVNLQAQETISSNSSYMDVADEANNIQEMPVLTKMNTWEDSPATITNPDSSARTPLLDTQVTTRRLLETQRDLINKMAPISPSPLLHFDVSALDSGSSEDITLNRKVALKKDQPTLPLSPPIRRNEPKKLSNRSSAASSNSSIFPKLERAIYSVAPNRYLKILKVLGVIYLLICVALCVGLYLKITSELSLFKGNISILTASSMRLFYIVGLNRLSRSISQTLSGLISTSRYAFLGVPDILQIMAPLIYNIQQLLLSENNIVRRSIENISEDLRREFYDNLVPVVSVDGENNNYALNTLDMVSVITTQAQNLVKITNLTEAQQQLSTLNFILNNTLNDLLVKSEDISEIVLDDSLKKISLMNNLTTYMIIVCSFCGALILLVYGYQQIKMTQRRNRLIEVFSSLNKNDIEDNIRRVKIIKNELREVHLDLKDTKYRESWTYSRVRRASESFRIAGRIRSMPVNYLGINANISKMSISLVMLIVISIIPFIVINAVILLKNDVSITEINSINKINSNLYDMTLTTVAIYEYIEFNGATRIRDRPISEEWEAAFLRSSSSQISLAELAVSSSDHNSVVDDEVTMFLRGNLCNLVPNLGEVCPYIRTGIFDKGIIGMNSFLLSVLRDTKDSFDFSDRSLGSKIAALNTANLILSEVVYNNAQLPAYQIFSQIIQSRAEEHIQEVKDTLIFPVIAAVIAFILIGFASVTLFKPFEKERVKWKKMLRKIPFNIVVSNKLLKTYLVKEAAYNREFIDLKL